MFYLLSKYLQRIGIDYNVIKDGEALDFLVNAPQGHWNCMMSLVKNSGLGFYSTLLIPVPQQKRTRVALFLMYLNNLNVFGSFEIDLKNGDVRFKTYLDCESMELTEQAIDRTMLRNVTTMQKYFPQIMELIQKAA